jgi:hypothetical protein
MGRTLSYRDAVVLLGGDPPAMAALDRALGGALSIATGGASDAAMSLVDAQGGIVRLGRDVAAGLRDRLRGVTRADRTRRLEAAHTVLAVTAYFEALADAPLPFALRDLQLTRRDQVRLAGGSAPTREFLAALLTVGPPRPAPYLPYEDFLGALRRWYGQLSSRLAAYVRGLAVWDGLGDAERAQAERALGEDLCRDAGDRFEQLYARLAVEVPEFGFWSGRVEHQATRTEVRRALAGVESLLASLSSARPPVDVARALSRAYRAALRRPILAEGDAPAGMRLPSLEEGYLDPDFRVRAVAGESWPSDEAWWSEAPVRADLTEYLVGALTSPEATAAPLVVLGQPGAGKSVLTKVLAARLPAADFLPVRVVLREAPAEADVQDQVEVAIRAATGERAHWPDVARAAGGATPVVLLDGFDELLQATGVSQSDYLVRVSRFQRREADQGRPVVAVVTSRTAVANRARYPEGAVALRLEPFRTEQVDEWLGVWNRHNEGYLTSRGLATLPAQVVARQQALAAQPLLLLMLALYDADANALQRGTGTGGGCGGGGGPDASGGGRPLDEAELYEELLAAFAGREVGKSGAALPEHEAAARVEQELQRLSLVAFAMVNRRRQWVTGDELDGDLAALLGRRETAAGDFRAPLTQADVALGRFFFVQRAQAMREGTRLQTYEFLHATFGEYLAARLTVQLAAGLLAQRPALAVGPAPVDDDLLYALLSFAPLSSRQILRFVRGVCARRMPQAERRRLADLLVRLLADSAARTEHRHAGYRPAAIAVSSRHGIYSANLVLLILVLVPTVTASELFRGVPNPVDAWHRRVLLWRSSLTEMDWTELALALRIRHTWNGPDRDLTVRLADGPLEAPEPVDAYWLYRHPIGREDRGGGIVWGRRYWDELNHKMDVSGGTNDSVIRHAIEPLFRWVGPAVTTFVGTSEGRATSVAHEMMNLCLARVLGSDQDLAAAYQRCSLIVGFGFLDAEPGRRIAVFVLDHLQADARRLPATTVVECLEIALLAYRNDEQILRLSLRSALAALSADPDGEQCDRLTRLVSSFRVLLAEDLRPDHLNE